MTDHLPVMRLKVTVKHIFNLETFADSITLCTVTATVIDNSILGVLVLLDLHKLEGSAI